MNSAQRRKAQRAYPHSITVNVYGMDMYSSYDRKIIQARSWCKKQCKGDWKVETDWDHAVFKFTEHKDATIFALKWV
jgi:hypothetical protein